MQSNNHHARLKTTTFLGSRRFQNYKSIPRTTHVSGKNQYLPDFVQALHQQVNRITGYYTPWNCFLDASCADQSVHTHCSTYRLRTTNILCTYRGKRDGTTLILVCNLFGWKAVSNWLTFANLIVFCQLVLHVTDCTVFDYFYVSYNFIANQNPKFANFNPLISSDLPYDAQLSKPKIRYLLQDPKIISTHCKADLNKKVCK